MYAHASEGQTICGILAIVQSELLTPLISLLTVLAVFLFLWGVIQFIAGASDEKARTTGKTHMIWGLFGLLIMGVSWAFIEIFQNFFDPGIPGGSYCSFG